MKAALLLGTALLAVLTACGEDGAGGGGQPAGGAARGRGAPPDLSTSNLVIISLDTLRADGLSTGGGPAGISPTLAAFASESIVFSAARSQAPHTAPSHMTLFTSTYPSVHGVENVAHETDEETGASHPVIIPMREDIPTLAQVLAADGFRTVGLTDGGNLNPPHGFDRGFEHYTYDLSGAQAQVDDGIHWVGELTAPAAGRFFLFWHTYQIHAPYVPPEPFLSRWATAKYDGPVKARIEQLAGMDFKHRFGAISDVFWKDRQSFGWPESAYLHGLYKGEVAYTDDQLGRLFAELRKQGVFDNSIVVVIGDHGEEFFEHGRWQHEQVYEECLRVPLMLRLPGGFGGGRVIDTPVGLIDVMPTVLELLDVNPPEGSLPGRIRHEGISFASAALGRGPVRERPIISELKAMRGGDWTWLVAIEANGAKLIYDEVRGHKLEDGTVVHEQQLYDLANDPTERRNLAAQGGPALDALLALHDGFQTLVGVEGAGAGEMEPATMDCDEIRAMVELGYLGADALQDCGD